MIEIKKINNRLITRFISIVIFQFTFFFSHSQIKITTKKNTLETEFDFIPFVSNQQIAKSTYRFFPTLENTSDSTIATAIILSDSISQNEDIYNAQMTVSLKRDLYTASQKSYLYINFYAKNVASLNLEIVDDRDSIYINNFQVDADQYSGPLQLPLFNWFRDMTPTKIREINLSVTKRNLNLPFTLALGELKAKKITYLEKPAAGYFFYEWTGDTNHHLPKYSHEDFGDIYPMKSFTIYRDMAAQNYYVESNDNAMDTVQKQTLSLLAYAIKKYPYYEVKGISKARTIFRVDSLIASEALSFSEKLQNVESVINSFNDKHFNLSRKEKSRANVPLHIREINGEYIVVGVFDKDLQSKVAVGDCILEIDGKALKKISDWHMQERVFKFVTKNNSDSAILLVKDTAGNQNRLVLHFSNKLNIPKNYRPVHCKTEIYRNSVYFKFNTWDSQVWTTFYNHKDELLDKSNIIIDLRGNPGGNEAEAYRVLSCFITQEIAASNSVYIFENGRKKIATNIVKPNDHLNLLNKNVKILLDGNTACASELFIALMKKYVKATLIGSEPSMGSYSSAEYFHLPFDLTLQANVITQFYVNDMQKIEAQGIEPDIYVPIFTYVDLYPYEDKILKYALQAEAARYMDDGGL